MLATIQALSLFGTKIEIVHLKNAIKHKCQQPLNRGGGLIGVFFAVF